VFSGEFSNPKVPTKKGMQVQEEKKKEQKGK
jgi:hypothetical protein